MRDIIEGFKGLIIFIAVLIVLFLGWAFSGGFTPFDLLMLIAVVIHYVWAFKLGKSKQSPTYHKSKKSSRYEDDPIRIRR